MADFIFKMTDGSEHVMRDVPRSEQNSIWNHIDKVCAKFESDNVKVRTVICNQK